MYGDKRISDKDTLKIWNEFEMKNMEEYHDLHLKTDVLLVADVFEEFRICIKYDGLYPFHYFSSLGLNWDSMLKMTDARLDLLSDIEMHQFIEKAIGGESYRAEGCSKANNKYMKSYDNDKPSKCTIQEDVNDLYG